MVFDLWRAHHRFPRAPSQCQVLRRAAQLTLTFDDDKVATVILDSQLEQEINQLLRGNQVPIER
jgi:hypothetical protein